MASKIDFFGLPRAVQDRFAAATRSTAPPTPLLFQRAPRTRAWLYLGGGAAFAVLAVLFMSVGYADRKSSWALHDETLLLVTGALFALAAYGVLHALSLISSFDLLPYRPGTYLFPGCAVDASGPVLTVWPVGDAESVEPVTEGAPGVALRMRDGTRVIIPAANVRDAARAGDALGSLRRELAGAIADEDPLVLSELDPLHDRAMSSPIGPTHPMRRRIPLWTRFDWAIAAVVGLTFGQVLGASRNALSDEAMFRAVTQADDAADYELYLAHGMRHKDEVQGTLLPRTELRQAAAAGTADAIERFAETHPNSRIDGEVQAALYHALLSTLQQAKQAGTLAALDAFARAHPTAIVQPELRAARHALYAKALASYRQSGHPDPAALDAVERLLSFAETNGPAAEVRFRLVPSSSLADADKSVRRSGHFAGSDALPSNYVTSDALRAREERVAADLAAGFDAAFPGEILSVHAAERVPEGAFAPAVPTFFVEYSPEWSRSNALCVKPNTVFAGLIFNFTTTFLIPDSPSPRTVVRAWRGAETWKFKPDALSLFDYHKRVYDSMVDAMFDSLDRRLVEYWNLGR